MLPARVERRLAPLENGETLLSGGTATRTGLRKRNAMLKSGFLTALRIQPSETRRTAVVPREEPRAGQNPRRAQSMKQRPRERTRALQDQNPENHSGPLRAVGMVQKPKNPDLVVVDPNRVAQSPPMHRGDGNATSPVDWRQGRHLMEQPAEAVWSAGPSPVLAMSLMASSRSVERRLI